MSAKLVLIVDDEHNLVDFLKEILETFDVDVIFAYDGEQALELIKENLNELELVFLDVVLPKIDGLVVYKKIRKLSADLQIIFMSAFPLAELSDDENLFFLPKPFVYDDIEILLEKMKF